MGIDRGLRKIHSVAVHVTALPKGVPKRLAHAVFVGTPNIEADVTETNVVDHIGAVPQLRRVKRGDRRERVTVLQVCKVHPSTTPHYRIMTS